MYAQIDFFLGQRIHCFDFGLCCFFLSGQLAAISEEREKPTKDQCMLITQETRNIKDTSLKVGQFVYIRYDGGFCSYLL